MVSLTIPQNTLQQWLRAGRVSQVTKLVNILLVVWLAWQLAALSWTLFPDESGDATVEIPAVRPSTPVKRQETGLDEQQIASWHVFGEASQAKPVVKKETPVNAPETRLKLKLSGVFASDEPEHARAIVGDPKGKQESYAVGDPLPGGATLSEIYPDRIILERSGRFETLRLPKEKTKSESRTVSHRRSTPLATSSSGGNRAAAFQKYRKEIRQNPASLMNYVRATPARKNGKFIGFRLQAGKQRGALKELGLQPGDIVTTINGVQIDTPANGLKAMQALGEGDSVAVTLLRGAEEISMNLTVPASK